MGEIKIKISDETEKQFRMLAMQKFGFGKGSISEAAAEAIENWAGSGNEDKSFRFSFKKMKGVLRNIKKSSVELQHDAWRGLYEKHANRH